MKNKLLLNIALIGLFINNKNKKNKRSIENNIINNYAPPYLPEFWNTLDLSQFSHNCYSYFLNDLFDKNIGNLHQPGVFNSLINNKNFNNNDSPELIINNVIADNPKIEYISLEQTSNFKCKSNYYRGMCLIDSKYPNTDFHFIRQDCLMIKTLRYFNLFSEKLNLNSNDKIILIINIFKTLNPEYYMFLENKLKKKDNMSNNKKLDFIYKNSFIWSHKRGSHFVTNKDANNNFIIDPLESSWDYPDSLNYKPICFFMITNNSRLTTYSLNLSNNYDWFNTERKKEVGLNETDNELIKRMYKLIY